MARAIWRKILEASKEEALLAVKLYNEPVFSRSLEGFVVHMHLAWLYLLQAQLVKERVEFRYPDPKHKGRYLKVDGEYQTWDLAKTAKHKWSTQNPVRANLEFFIKLRNRIEHRHTGRDEALAAAIGGQSHALLLNYEKELTAYFGESHSMANMLRFPVFIGTFTEAAEEVLVKLQNDLSPDLRNFLAEYDASIDSAIRDDSRYRLKLRVFLEAAPNAGEMALQFTRYDDLSDDQKKSMDELKKSGRVLVREQMRPVQNKGLMRPTQAMNRIAEGIPYKFNSYDFKLSWKNNNIRPLGGSPHPERTREEFCVYNDTHNDYLYTEAFVKYMIRKCSTKEGFLEVVGRQAKAKKHIGQGKTPTSTR